MKPSLAAGLSFTRQFCVDTVRTIGFMGEEGRVYATPALIGDIEYTCRDGILDHLDPGEDSVGTRVELDHLAPTLPGMAVEIIVTVAEVKGRLVSFDVTARDTLEEIGRGRHVRFVVDVRKTQDRLRAKAARAGGSA
jgi:predicted thioesterase